MVGRYLGHQLPWERYRAVPEGWHMVDVMRLHAQLGGSYPIAPSPQANPGSRRAAPLGSAWLEYRATLYGVAEGVQKNDPACVDIAVRFIEFRYIGSHAGYLRALMARRLRHATRTPAQDDRLNAHFASLAAKGERCYEFASYLKLWRALLTEARLLRLDAQLVNGGASAAQAQWVHAALNGLATSRRVANAA